MPIHDWSSVEAGVFHYFHMRWIAAICDALNMGILPRNYYAMGEQQTPEYELGVLALYDAQLGNDRGGTDESTQSARDDALGGVLLAPPKVSVIAEAETERYRRKQNAVIVRHVRGDQIVAIIEIVSKGNKSTRQSLDQFVKKVGAFLGNGIHLLIVDLQTPGRYDPQGIHGAIWEYIAGQDYVAPVGKPLTVAAYESDRVFRSYVEPVAVADCLPDMPLFLRPGRYINVPLEGTCQNTWDVFPPRWRDVIEGQR
jgi:hypothetical protein